MRVSASRSKRTPLVTKKTGMKKPKPIASSLRRKSGWVMTWSRSTSETIAPAMNAPRIDLEPELRRRRPRSRRTARARRGRGSARSCPAGAAGRRGCASSARRRGRRRSTTAASANSEPSSSSVEPVPPSPEKKIVSRMIAPKSAIDAAAMISWPNVEAISPASLSTGTSTPSDVAHRMIATSSGVSTRPRRAQPERHGDARRRTRARSPSAVSRSTGPRSFANSISSPARNSTNASPISATTAIAWSTSDDAEHRRADDDARRRSRAPPRAAAGAGTGRARTARRTRPRRREQVGEGGHGASSRGGRRALRVTARAARGTTRPCEGASPPPHSFRPLRPLRRPRRGPSRLPAGSFATTSA